MGVCIKGEFSFLLPAEGRRTGLQIWNDPPRAESNLCPHQQGRFGSQCLIPAKASETGHSPNPDTAVIRGPSCWVCTCCTWLNARSHTPRECAEDGRHGARSGGRRVHLGSAVGAGAAAVRAALQSLRRGQVLPPVHLPRGSDRHCGAAAPPPSWGDPSPGGRVQDRGCLLHRSLCPAGLPHCCIPWRSLLGSN